MVRAVVGTDACVPQCICDVDGVVGSTVNDALRCLQHVVGEDVALDCECVHGPTGKELQLNDYTTNDQWRPRVAAGANGEFVVAWESYGSSGSDTDLSSVQVRRFRANGRPKGAQFQANTFTPGPQTDVGVAADDDGNFVVCWSNVGASASDDDASVRARLFDRNGVPMGEEFQVNTYTTGGQSRPDVGMDPTGAFVVVWESRGSSDSDTSGASVHGQRYDDAGALVGTEFQVNVGTSSDQSSPAVAVGADGRFVVAWSSQAPFQASSNIKARRYDRSGVPAVGEVNVSRSRFAERSYPDVAFDSTGGFVVAYNSYNYYGCGYHTYLIEARRFDSNGVPRDEGTIVNNCPKTLEQRASVTTLSTGGFVVTWEGGNAGTANSDILARIVNADGYRVGGIVRVNTHVATHQSFADVARGVDGSFLVVWRSGGSNGSDSSGAGINGQRFEALER
jgi:hypothetical protein